MSNAVIQRPSVSSPASRERRVHLIDRIKYARRMQAHFASTEAAMLRLAFDQCVEETGGPGSEFFDLEYRSMLFEIGIETNTSDRSVNRDVDQAWSLFEHYRKTARAWRSGDLARRHVEVIIKCGDPIVDAEVRAEYERLVLEYARENTPGRTESYARRVAAELDPEIIAARQQQARRERSVRVRDLDDGMSQLVAEIDSACAHAILDRLTAAARAVSQQPGGTGELDAFGRRVGNGRSGDARSFDAIRADALVDMLLAGQVPADSPQIAINAIQPRVAITVSALALMGVSDEPAMLDGVGPMPIDLARQLCAGAGVWLRVLTHPVSGAALSADTYRPTAALRRFIETRDQHCRAPGCRRPARDCDLDHSKDWAQGGATTHDNLAALCPSHHTIKHRGWRLSQTAQGELQWRSPSGRTVTDRPDRLAAPWYLPKVLADDDPADPAPF